MAIALSKQRFLLNIVRPGFLLCLAISIAAVTQGCKSKITDENYKKIETGMSLKQVEEILGGPGKEVPTTNLQPRIVDNVMVTDIASIAKTFEWKDDKRTIKVTFLNGKAADRGLNGRG